MNRVSALLFCLQIVPALSDATDTQWMDWLQSPPQEAIELTKTLTQRAEKIAAALPKSLKVSGDVDVVVSGGGNLDAFFLGVYSVLKRIPSIRMHRFAGASAGGMMPFEIALKGEATTFYTHLSYGMMEEKFSADFSNVLEAAALQDHHWRLLAKWQSQKWNSTLYKLDNIITLALSCLDPFPTLVKVNNYTSIDQATSAFMGTGTAFEWYDNMLCSDGGAMSGPKMTPLFQDKQRPQIIVDLMQTGFPESMVVQFNTTSYASLVKRGQDEAEMFVQTAASKANAITVCPASAKVSGNICEQ